ncbi:MAG TPA: hypothetical protein VF511_00775 [Chthoniobacterales bacterium]
MDQQGTRLTGNQQEFNGYIFDPQGDGSIVIHLSGDAGRTVVTTLPGDLVAALGMYFAVGGGSQQARGMPPTR